MAGFSLLQSVSRVMQYFMHFAQQMLSGSKMASRGHTRIQARQSVHLLASMLGRALGARPRMAVALECNTSAKGCGARELRNVDGSASCAASGAAAQA
jgi:hypothetical protein